jgi:uncharacterized protein YecE (DUF72 family)
VGLPEYAGVLTDSFLPLFDPAPEESESTVEQSGFDREALKERLSALARRRIYVGGSSWKYEGWLGQIYSPSKYQVRGRFSKELFEETCLSEYAHQFPTVCGDFAFYQFPTETFWAKLFRQTPETFRWGFKVPEQITVPVWPVHPRYGALAGRPNPDFLNAPMFVGSLLGALEPYRERIGVLIFEFGTQRVMRLAQFVRALDGFLARLPQGWRYAVEIRTPEFLARDYFACLQTHGVTHVYNAWARMPEIREQMELGGSQTAEAIVARALLRRGRPYAEAVEEFAPYKRVQEVNQPVRDALRKLIDVARVDERPAFIFINNRLEGNSPGTIAAIAG